MPKLTNAMIEAAKPEKVKYEIRDDEVKGLSLIVHPRTASRPNGLRTFAVRTYISATRKRFRTKLGEYGVITLEEARRRAREALVLADEGTSPTEVLRPKGPPPGSVATVGEACRQYFEEYAQRRCSPTTLRSLGNRIDRWIIPLVGKLSLNEISRQHVTRMHQKIGDESPGSADRAVTELSAVLTWCQGMGYRDQNLANPCRRDRRGISGVKSFGTQEKRDRVLRRSEIDSLFKALDHFEKLSKNKKKTIHPDTVVLIKLLFYTGGRLSELWRLAHGKAIEQGHYLHWDQVSLSGRHISLGRTKEKESKVIYLCEQAVKILQRHHAAKEKEKRLDQPVFECYNPGRAWRTYIRPMAKLDSAKTKEAFTLHHFRHNFLSYAAMAGIPEQIRKRAVGHAASKDITEGYTHIAVSSMAKAVQKIGDALDKMDFDAFEE